MKLVYHVCVVLQYVQYTVTKCASYVVGDTLFYGILYRSGNEGKQTLNVEHPMGAALRILSGV